MSASRGASDTHSGDVADGAGWQWVRWETRSLSPHISFYYRSKIWKKIQSRLNEVGNEALVRRFASGCFGHLLEWREIQCSAQATHAVVARQIIIEGAADNELWFRVRGQHLRFSFREYALVTGFRFGPTDFDPSGWYDASNVGVYRRFFGDEKTTAGDLLGMFQAGVKGATNDDYLKVANLLVLYMFGLGYDSTKVIDDYAWVLVDDLEVWNRFPWGAYTYQALMHYVYRVGRTKEECGSRYHLFGPMWALQIWAYEAIPDLASVAAVADRPQALPRCLRWKFIRPKVNNFLHYFNREVKRPCHRTLNADANEVHQDYWQSVIGPDPVGVTYVVLFNEATARIRIEGAIRKSKLLKRRKQLAEERETKLRERKMAETAQCWEKRQREVMLHSETSFVTVFKETMHAETKKVIISSVISAMCTSASAPVCSSQRMQPMTQEHNSACFKASDHHVNYGG